MGKQMQILGWTWHINQQKQKLAEKTKFSSPWYVCTAAELLNVLISYGMSLVIVIDPKA